MEGVVINTFEGAVAKAGMSLMSNNSSFELVGKLLEKGLTRVNTTIDIRKLQQDIAHGEDRTIMIYIYGYPDGYMFHFEHGNIVRVPTSYAKPTVTAAMPEEILIALATGKRDFEQVFWANEIDFTGEYWVRDKVVFAALFEEFGHICREMGLLG